MAFSTRFGDAGAFAALLRLTKLPMKMKLRTTLAIAASTGLLCATPLITRSADNSK